MDKLRSWCLLETASLVKYCMFRGDMVTGRAKDEMTHSHHPSPIWPTADVGQGPGPLTKYHLIHSFPIHDCENDDDR